MNISQHYYNQLNEKYTKTNSINSFQVLKFMQTHLYFHKIYVAADLQQGTKLRSWGEVIRTELNYKGFGVILKKKEFIVFN